MNTLSDLLGVKSRLRMLEVLMEADKPLKIGEIIDEAGAGRDGWYREGPTLIEEGLVVEVPTASRGKQYKVNRENRIVHKLTEIKRLKEQK